ncbi:MAG: energy-coupling factor ABC transporter permease [Candidatus Omnitrophica bacterium]|nr:energy-coupling factor ABC transporter permease [Candidatus Omnitrophota bacterium]
MLHGAVCPVTVAVSVAGVGAAIYVARKVQEKPTALKFATLTCMIFALQMLNFPVQNGTSGHLLGGVLAVALLGIPFAVIAMAIVLTVQAVFFADGGVNALGANIINMSFIGAACAGLLFYALRRKGMALGIALAITSWISVVMASAACALELSLAGTVNFSKALTAMVSVHALIGLGEAVVTVGLFAALEAVTRNRRSGLTAVASFGVAAMAAMLSPFASKFPDGLEFVSKQMAFVTFSNVKVNALFSDYQIPALGSTALSTILAGLIGVGIVLALAYVSARSLTQRQ